MSDYETLDKSPQRPQEIGGFEHERLTGNESVGFVYPDDGEGDDLDTILEKLSAGAIEVADAKTRILSVMLEQFGGWLANLLRRWMDAAGKSPVAAAAIRVLGLHGKQTLREAAKEIGCSPALITRHQKRLEAAMGPEGVNNLR